MSSRTNRMLRDTLVEIGDMGERLSHIRDTLLVLQRAVPFVAEHGDGWLDEPVKARLKMAGSDVQSLNDYEVHLTDKIQFLLDAALGFINTEQNDLFKVLTIASVVGIPPTFIASMYGMNFHNMPELSWAWGYQWGLFLIVLSTVLPIVWFKCEGLVVAAKSVFALRPAVTLPLTPDGGFKFDAGGATRASVRPQANLLQRRILQNFYS